METSFYKKPLVCHLAHHCILKANFRDKKTIFNGQDILIKRGSFITGRKQLSIETGLSQQNVRSALKVLKNIGFLTTKSTNRFSIVSIVKYDDYQSSNQPTNQQINQQLTNKQPTTNQQVTTTNNKKNVKNDKKKKAFIETSNEFQLSKLLLDLILKRDLNHKKPDLQEWSKHIDYLIRIDGREPERIKKVINWCQQDDFWMNNILSTKKLRKQFNQLNLKLKKEEEYI